MKSKILIMLMGFFLFSHQMFAQDVSISGNVKDEKGEALIGVTIQVKGTTKSRKTKCAGREKRNAYFGAKTKSDSKVPIVTFSFGLFNQNISVIQTAFKRHLNGAFSFDFLLK